MEMESFQDNDLLDLFRDKKGHGVPFKVSSR
jgi:hypothetical protein